MSELRGPWPEALAAVAARLAAPAATVHDSLDLLAKFAVRGDEPPRMAYCGMPDRQHFQ
jgi:hypothetical protein